MMVDFQPDTIIALARGSAMDAAKAMWMFFEHPRHHSSVLNKSS